MLSDEQKEQLSAEIIPLFQDLEQEVIQDIARRVRKEKRWTETAELQAKALEKLGYSPHEIRTAVLKKLHADKEYIDMINKNTLEHKRAVKEEIDRVVAEAKKNTDDIVSRAGDMAFADDIAFWNSAGRRLKKSPELAQIGAETSKRLAHELKSLTHSTGFKFTGRPIRAEKAFNYAMDKAVMNVASGTFSTQQAVEQVVSDLEKSGLRKVDFASGVSRGIDVAANLAVRTTLGQMAADISMSNAEELGADLVEVSSHAGARSGEGHADHAAWQGKVYSISGKSYPEESKRIGYKIEKLSDVTGYPDDPAGLCGYNCRHTFYPFIEGVSEPNPIEEDPEPVEVDGKTYTYYQATRKQRRLERELREYKRQHIGGTNRIAAIKAKEQQYARFCEKAGLKQNLNRLYVKGYKRDFAYIINKEAQTHISFINATTKSEGTDYLKNKLGFLRAKFSGMSIGSINKVNKALTEIYGEHPQLKGFIQKIETDKKLNGIAAFRMSMQKGKINTSIAINPNKIGNLDDIKRTVQVHSECGYWTYKDGIKGIIKHELGHAIEASQTFKEMGVVVFSTDVNTRVDRYLAFRKYAKHTVAERELKKAFKNANIELNSENLKKHISGYAQDGYEENHTYSEAFAEAFSDEKANTITSFIQGEVRRW